MIAVAGLVHAKGVGCEFHDRMKACRWSRNARLESKSVRPSDCLPRTPEGFDLIEPRSAGRRVVKMDLGMASQPCLDIGSAVGGRVVEDDVQFLVGVGAHDPLHEAEEVHRRVRLGQLRLREGTVLVQKGERPSGSSSDRGATARSEAARLSAASKPERANIVPLTRPSNARSSDAFPTGQARRFSTPARRPPAACRPSEA